MRPCTIGELLDRAVTLFVRNAWTFVALSAIVYVPLALAQLTMGDFWKWYLDTVSVMIAHPGNAGAAAGMNQQLLQRAGPVELFTFAVMLFLAPVVVAAMANLTLHLIDGTTTTIGQTLRFALTRWGRVMLFGLVWFVSVLVAMVAIIFGLAFLGVIASVAAHVVALFVFVGLLAFVLAAAVMLLALVSGGVGLMAAINEPASALAAFGSGIRRTINRKMFWRSVLAGLLLFAISFGFSIMAAIAGFGLLASLHSGIPLIVINAAVAMVQFGFLTVFLVLFYNDLRVRLEGADLEALAARLPA